MRKYRLYVKHCQDGKLFELHFQEDIVKSWATQEPPNKSSQISRQGPYSVASGHSELCGSFC